MLYEVWGQSLFHNPPPSHSHGLFAFHSNSKGNYISFGSEEVSLRNLETVGMEVNITLFSAYLSLFPFLL